MQWANDGGFAVAINQRVWRRLMASFKRLEAKGYLLPRANFPPHPLGCDCLYIPTELDRLVHRDLATYEKPAGDG